MAQLPASLRSEPQVKAGNQTMAGKLSGLGSWLLVVAALILCGMGVWGLAHRLLHAPVAEVMVTGDISSAEQSILQRGIQPLIHENYFTADLTKIRDAVLDQSWVESVTVTRHWPDGLLVRVIPRQPIARWGSGRLLSGRGTVFTEAVRQDHNDLPLLHGPISQSVAMMQQYQQIDQWFTPLGLRLKELYLTDRMTWFMSFDSGLRVIVDQEQTNLKLQRLSDLGQGDEKLRGLWSRIAAVDLRYRNGMAIQWKDVAMNQRPVMSTANAATTLTTPSAPTFGALNTVVQP
ncbi:cell division protein FtsQ/DivIB [Aquirhabdus parva]|uniref:Cell division protein FtsQ n=1 Tax=Aquirhabdus parva TaxID=2283318 RepID=A0A345P2U5_9GAMM|nr:cell division protein FtsQ/DivIB [Aquirhabdus parva]AXI01604.1 cell division protein FtsQ [Aquirhabdus parva]